MHKLLLFALLLLSCVESNAQNDIIVIRKKGVPVKTFFEGGVASFQTKSGEWFSGKITAIRDDSLFFKDLVIRQVMTPLGVSRMDTMTTLTRSIHYSEIAAIPKPLNHLHIQPEGLMMIGGAGYAALNLVNSAYLHYAPFGHDNRPKLLTALGVFAAGYMLSTFRNDNLLIGKKYTLHYVRLGKP